MSGSCESHPQPPSRDAYPTLCGKSQSEKTLKLLDDHWRPLKAKIAGNPVVLSRGERLDIFSPKKYLQTSLPSFTGLELALQMNLRPPKYELLTHLMSLLLLVERRGAMI